MAAVRSSETDHPLRRELRSQLRRILGDQAEVVSLHTEGDRLIRGVAVCPGRVLSFVMDAEQQRLRTQPLFALLQRTSRR